jgi:5-methylcytosine-specific restriction endonuclease McrA
MRCQGSLRRLCAAGQIVVTPCARAHMVHMCTIGKTSADDRGLMSRAGHRTYRRRRAHVLKTSDTCHWCGRWLDPELKYPHPHSATVDHVIPVSRGGSSTGGQLVASCWECNKGRSNRLGPPLPKRQQTQARQPPKPIHGREW